jgi:hypothetical protein
MDLPPQAQTVSDVPDDFKPRPLGSRSGLMTAILSAAPMADFSDPSWGRIANQDFSIEVNSGEGGKVGSIMLYARGGDQAPGLITKILDRLNAWALDIQTGKVFDETAAASFSAWRAYRDQVINQPRHNLST